MSEKATIYSIAEKLNITAATVSRALNNNPRISEHTRKLVLEMAEKLNYKQNKLALALKSGRTNNVGVIVPYINRNFFSSIIRGIEEELYPQGYHVIICQTHETEKRETENINTLLNAQVDGILMSISGGTVNTDHFYKVLNRDVPLVFFDRKKNIEGVSTVTIDDFNGGYKATKHLIDQGCKRIAHLAGDRSLEIYKDRFEGYKKALADHGMEYNGQYVLHVKNTIEAGRKATNRLLKLKEIPDAIFSASDFIALGVMGALKSKGIRIPQDICIVGFSNEPFTSFAELSISSVDQSPLEMGKMAARVFLEQVSDAKHIKIEKKVVLTPELHIRRSSLKSVPAEKLLPEIS